MLYGLRELKMKIFVCLVFGEEVNKGEINIGVQLSQVTFSNFQMVSGDFQVVSSDCQQFRPMR